MSELPKIETTPSPEDLFGPSFVELRKAFVREGLLMSQIGAKMELMDLSEVGSPEEVREKVREKMLKKHIPELNEAKAKTQEAIAQWLEVIGQSQE